MPMGAPSAPSQMMPGPPGGGVLQEGQGVAGIVAHGGAIVMMQGASVGLTSLAPPVTNPGGGSGGGLNPGMSISRAPNPPAALGPPSFAMPGFRPPPPGEPGLAMRKQRGREGKEARSRPYNKARCPHNRDHYSCRECGGAGICMHKKRKSQVGAARAARLMRECVAADMWARASSAASAGARACASTIASGATVKSAAAAVFANTTACAASVKTAADLASASTDATRLSPLQTRTPLRRPIADASSVVRADLTRAARLLLQNLCRDCGGSGICIHKHQKNKVTLYAAALACACVRCPQAAALVTGAQFAPAAPHLLPIGSAGSARNSTRAGTRPRASCAPSARFCATQVRRRSRSRFTRSWRSSRRGRCSTVVIPRTRRSVKRWKVFASWRWHTRPRLWYICIMCVCLCVSVCVCVCLCVCVCMSPV